MTNQHHQSLLFKSWYFLKLWEGGIGVEFTRMTATAGLLFYINEDFKNVPSRPPNSPENSLQLPSYHRSSQKFQYVPSGSWGLQAAFRGLILQLVLFPISHSPHTPPTWASLRPFDTEAYKDKHPVLFWYLAS